MTEPKADLNSDLTASSVEAGSSATPATAAAATVRIDAPNLAPEQDDASQEVPKPEPRRSEQAKAQPSHPASKILIMSPQRERSWEDFVNSEPPPEPEYGAASGKRRVSMVAAVVALAAATGAVGGSLATAGIGHWFGNDDGKAMISQTHALEESIMRIDADIAALKIGAERHIKQAAAQSAKTAERLDRIEKAQVEPAARLAKLSETVEKLRVPPAPVAAPVASVAAKEITGSITPAPVPTTKPEIARLPTLDGWVLLNVADGGATIEGRQGIFEVYAGDPVPGLGRVDAIRKQDGRWTVVTSKGLIVAR
ncbi:MAG: hypothetical protein H7312_12420 [Tardiphaga sp.]|nr:hypothetical protein [Tardiphaga sp.]